MFSNAVSGIIFAGAVYQNINTSLHGFAFTRLTLPSLMNFLYPSFLWALAALSIPVIIHLFNFRRTTRVYFSNNRFLKNVQEASSARRKLKHYLILASRLLFLFFLVIAFAQPFIPAKDQLSDHRNITVYLDNSQSMSAQMDDKTRGLNAAIAFVNTILDVFPVDTRYRLITNDFAPFSNAYKTKAEIQELLTRIRLSPVSRTVAAVADRIRYNSSSRNQEIFWISDFQKSTFGEPLASVDTAFQVHLVPITFGSLSNVFVDSAYLENPFAAAGERNVLRVKMRNDGRRNVDQLAVKLTINGVQAGTTTIGVPQGAVHETSFDLTTGLTGLNEARLTFNDFPVSFDNEFFIALNFTDKIRVIEVKASSDPTPVEKVFGNTQVFTYRGYAVSNFNYSMLDQADLVVVNGLNTIDPSLAAALRNYLGNRGTVLLVPGVRPDVQAYRNFTQLQALSIPDNPEQMELDRPDFSNPFFENVFEERSVALAMPKARRILSWGSDRSAILQFKNDQPFLSRFEQIGQLYITASALDNTVTDFHRHGVFVPVMYRLAASSKKNENRLYHSLHENFLSLRMDSLKNDQPVKLVGKEEVIPAQRRVGDRLLIDIPEFSLSEGFYRVVSGRDTLSLIAFNLDKAESLLAQYAPDELPSLFGGGPNISIFEADSNASFSDAIKERYVSTPCCWHCCSWLQRFC
jgi:hypothetical protein